MDKDEILRLKVSELKAKLAELSLKTSGRKTTLQDRLLGHFGIEAEEEEEESENEGDNTMIEKNKNCNISANDNTYGRASDLSSEEENCEEKIERREVNESYSNKIFTLRDIRESLNYFNGGNQPNINKWLEEFEENAIAVNWDDLQKFIYAKQLIKGAAKIYIRGRPSINNWQKLKQALLEEFGEEVSAIDVHKKLQSRRKRYNESYLEYLYSLIEIGAHINIDEKSTIEYFVDGISDTTMNKSILYEANNISELKNRIKTYEKIKKPSNT